MQAEKYQLRDIFRHRHALWTLGIVSIHQSIVAGSSYFLTRLIELFQRGEKFEGFLLAYLVMMLIPYIPGCLSFVTLQAWVNNAHRALTERLANAAYGVTEKTRDARLQEAVESIATRNSFITIKDYLFFVHDFVGFFLNSALSMLVLGLLLPGNLLIGYIVGVTLCSLIILSMRKAIQTRSTAVEMDFVSYSDMLSRIWDNTTLGNRYNFLSWTHKRQILASRYYEGSNRLMWRKQLSNLALAGAALSPTIYLVAHAVANNSADSALLAAIFVSLTRIFHILNSLSTLVYQVLEWSSMNARLRMLSDTICRLSQVTTSSAFPRGEIYLNGRLISHFGQAAAVLSEKGQGRFTIKGSNGSGKSTLLLSLKKRFSDAAHLIPTHHGKLCWSDSFHHLSTGQWTLAQLREVAGRADTKYLLLDEWDANLDPGNTQEIDRMLDQLSAQKVVIEIRH